MEKEHKKTYQKLLKILVKFSAEVKEKERAVEVLERLVAELKKYRWEKSEQAKLVTQLESEKAVLGLK